MNYPPPSSPLSQLTSKLNLEANKKLKKFQKFKNANFPNPNRPVLTTIIIPNPIPRRRDNPQTRRRSRDHRQLPPIPPILSLLLKPENRQFPASHFLLLIRVNRFRDLFQKAAPLHPELRNPLITTKLQQHLPKVFRFPNMRSMFLQSSVHMVRNRAALCRW